MFGFLALLGGVMSLSAFLGGSEGDDEDEASPEASESGQDHIDPSLPDEAPDDAPTEASDPGGVVIGDTEGQQDLVASGAGNDTIEAGSSDIIHGQDGDDVIHGSSGVLAARGGAGDDLVDFSGSDADHPVLEGRGEAGADTLLGSGGDDFLVGGTGADQIRGGDGNDTIIGGEDATIHDMGGLAAEDDKEGDDIDAGDGDDLVFAGPGDVIRLGGGRDTASLTADPNSGGTTLFRDFTPGEDMIELHMPIDDSGSGSFADYVASRETTEEGTTISLTTGQTLIFEGAHEGIPDDAFTIVHRGLSAA